MDKASSVVAAFDSGKLPSTQQISQFIDWLNDVGITHLEPSSNTELSSHGRVLAGGLRQVLDAYKQFGAHKNADNILQRAIWHLTEGDLTITPEAEAEKDEATADIKALRLALRNMLSIVWTSITSEGSSIFHDLMSLVRLSIADAAELVEEQAGLAKESLRNVEQGVQDGERDSLGRDKKRLEDEKDTKVAWQHGMDTVKDAGTSVIGATQTVSSSVHEKAEKTSSRLQDAMNKIADRAQSDPQYRESLNTVFDILQKRLNATLDAASDPSGSIENFIADPTPEQHIPKALELLRTFLSRLANTPLDPFIAKFRTCTSSILKDPELKTWFDESLSFTRQLLSEPGFSRSEEAQHKRKDLRVRWRTLLEKDDKWKGDIDQLKEEWSKIETGIKDDEDLKRVRNAQVNLGRDIEDGLVEAGAEAQTGLQAAMEQATWFWQDLFKVYVPKMMNKLRDVPIPRTEYKDDEIEFVLENLDISSFNILPSHVYIRNITDIDITTSASPAMPSRTAVGTLTHIRIQALQLKLDDISFWYKDKNAGVLGPSEFTGLLGLKLPEKGVDVDLKVRLIPANVTGSKSRDNLKHFNVIEKVSVSISEDVGLEVRESNHTVLVTLFKPIMISRLREALEKTLTEQLRATVDWADGVAFDVSKRRQVFEDTGIGGGGSLMAAIWSEIGRLQRESRSEMREVGWRATGTGLIVEQRTVVPGEDEEEPDVKYSSFAMGAEPQILSGEKRGPVGTGSENLREKFGRVGDEVGVDISGAMGTDMDVDQAGVKRAAEEAVGEAGKRAKGAVKAAGKQVDSFKRSVDRKIELEHGRSGWQSAAFDF